MKFSKLLLIRIFLTLVFLHTFNAAYAQDSERPHHLSLFIGATHMLDIDHNGGTLGLDYEYRLNELLGVGFVAEHAFEEINADTYLAVADIHTPSGIIFQIGPGVEFGERHDRFIFRIGGLYEFEYETYTISPQLHFDIAENADDSIVLGFAIGKAF